MTMKYLLALIALLFLGCASHPVYTVYTSTGSPTSPATQLPGIPFYQLEPVEVNTTSYDQPWAEMAVAVTTKTPAGVENTVHHVRYIEDLQYAADLVARFAKAPDAVVAVRSVVAEYVADAQGKLRTAEPPQLEPVDFLKLKPIAVDRKRMQVVSLVPYYINSTVPFGGSGNANVVLGADGSLTSASSTVSDQLPLAIVGAIGALGGAAAGPIMTSILGGAAPPTVTLHSADAPLPTKVDAKMVVVHRIYTVTSARPTALGDAACDVRYALESPLVAMPNCRIGLSVKIVRPDAPPTPSPTPLTITVAGPVTKAP
jgi:hypothetical protein